MIFWALKEVSGRGYYQKKYGANSPVTDGQLATWFHDEDEAQKALDKVNDTCQDNDVQDSKDGRRPDFMSYELTKFLIGETDQK